MDIEEEFDSESTSSHSIDIEDDEDQDTPSVVSSNSEEKDDKDKSTGVDTVDDNVDGVIFRNTGVDDEDTEGTNEFEEPDHDDDDDSTVVEELKEPLSSASKRGDESVNSSGSSDNNIRSRVSGRIIREYQWPGYKDAFTNLSIDKRRRKNKNNKIKQEEFWEHQYFQGLFSNQKTSKIWNRASVVQSGVEQCNYERTMDFLDQASEHCKDKVSHILMTQYGLRARLKQFGKAGQAATEKDMKQMLSREVFKEIEYSTLSNDNKQLALPILLFLTRKRDGTVKGRACADGQKQRIWMGKKDTRSPTVSTEALFYLLMIDAYEERDVATLDLPGHFLQTPMEGRLILRIDGELALGLILLEPSRWQRHLQKIRGRDVIFVKCSKAIYGTLNAALLSYNKLIGHLRDDWGFTANPYDVCVWNKIVDGNQLTVAFHVDDIKISHKNPRVVDSIIENL